MEFPRLVYKSASNHFLVNDEAEFKASIKNGWFPTVPEALAGKLDFEYAEEPVEEPVIEEAPVEVAPVEEVTETLTLKGRK
jgi:hypothetical protein